MNQSYKTNHHKLEAIGEDGGKAASIMTKGVFDDIRVARLNFEKDLITIYPSIDHRTLYGVYRLYESMAKDLKSFECHYNKITKTSEGISDKDIMEEENDE